MKSTEEIIAKIGELDERIKELKHMRYKDIMSWQDVYMNDGSYTSLGRGTNKIESRYARLISKAEISKAFLEFQLYIIAKKNQIIEKDEEQKRNKF